MLFIAWPPVGSAVRSADPQGADLASAAGCGRQGPGRGLAAARAADPALRGKGLAVVSGIGDQASGSVLLDRLAETFALADPKVAELVEICSHPRSRLVLPTFAWLTDSKTPPLVAANMRLYYGRWLVQGQWFEEALEQLGGLKTGRCRGPRRTAVLPGRHLSSHCSTRKKGSRSSISCSTAPSDPARGATSPSPT